MDICAPNNQRIYQSQEEWIFFNPLKNLTIMLNQIAHSNKFQRAELKKIMLSNHIAKHIMETSEHIGFRLCDKLFLKKKQRATSLIYWRIILIHYTVFQGAFKKTLPKNFPRQAGQTPCLGKVKSMVWTFSGSEAESPLVLWPGLFPAVILK